VTGGIEVLIVSYHSASHVPSCLDSIVRTIPEARVAIREHGSATAFEQLQAAVAGRVPPVRIEHDPTNPGFAAGCNALARASSAEFLLFLNADVEIVTWPWSGARPPDHRTIYGPETLDLGHRATGYGPSYTVRDEVRRSWFRRRGPRPAGAGYVGGAALLIDSASFNDVGAFDDAYFMYYEDIDLCLRANRAGVRTVLEPTWTIRHSGAHSTSSRFPLALTWSYESACRFHRAQGDPVGVFRCYVVADSLGRAAFHGLRGSGSRARAYLSLSRRAATDLVRRPDPT
jgi:GT2 family glycosyltransferase